MNSERSRSRRWYVARIPRGKIRPVMLLNPRKQSRQPRDRSKDKLWNITSRGTRSAEVDVPRRVEKNDHGLPIRIKIDSLIAGDLLRFRLATMAMVHRETNVRSMY